MQRRDAGTRSRVASKAQPAITNGWRTTAPLAGKSMFMTGLGTRVPGQDAADAAVEAREIELARRVDAERGDVADRRVPPSSAVCSTRPDAVASPVPGAIDKRQRPDAAGDEVGEEVAARDRSAPSAVPRYTKPPVTDCPADRP